jgi:diguanylate cyclase (GGDEF)-like protein
MVAMVGASYFIDTVILYLFYTIGTTGFLVALFFGLAAIGYVLLFSTLHWTGFSENFSDPHLTTWQMLYAFIVAFIGITIAPQLIPYFLGHIFIIFGFSTLKMSFREAILSWLLCCLLLVLLVLYIAPFTIFIRVASLSEITVTLLAFATILLRLIGLGYYGTMLRIKAYEKTKFLQEEVNVAEELATHDVLTNAFNRRIIIPAIKELIALRKRNDIPACIAMIDLDRFKSINDSYGHLIGDDVLKKVADRMHALIRETDKLGRYGGEEFILVMPFTNIEDGTQIVERIREDIAKMPWHQVEQSISITISCGITAITTSDTTLGVIKRADDALIKAKKNGRNRTYCLDEYGVLELA